MILFFSKYLSTWLSGLVDNSLQTTQNIFEFYLNPTSPCFRQSAQIFLEVNLTNKNFEAKIWTTIFLLGCFFLQKKICIYNNLNWKTLPKGVGPFSPTVHDATAQSSISFYTVSSVILGQPNCVGKLAKHSPPPPAVLRWAKWPSTASTLSPERMEGHSFYRVGQIGQDSSLLFRTKSSSISPTCSWVMLPKTAMIDRVNVPNLLSNTQIDFASTLSIWSIGFFHFWIWSVFCVLLHVDNKTIFLEAMSRARTKASLVWNTSPTTVTLIYPII
jgi:hypothetical protein